MGWKQGWEDLGQADHSPGVFSQVGPQQDCASLAPLALILIPGLHGICHCCPGGGHGHALGPRLGAGWSLGFFQELGFTASQEGRIEPCASWLPASLTLCAVRSDSWVGRDQGCQGTGHHLQASFLEIKLLQINIQLALMALRHT